MQIVRGSHAVCWDVLAFRKTEDPVRAKEILNEILNREDLQNPSAFVMKAMLTRHFRNMPQEVQSLASFPMCFFLHILAFVSLATFIVKWCSCKCSKMCPKGRPLSTSPHSDIEWTQSLRASKWSHYTDDIYRIYIYYICIHIYIMAQDTCNYCDCMWLRYSKSNNNKAAAKTALWIQRVYIYI
jgi:hypothetical protein